MKTKSIIDDINKGNLVFQEYKNDKVKIICKAEESDELIKSGKITKEDVNGSFLGLDDNGVLVLFKDENLPYEEKSLDPKHAHMNNDSFDANNLDEGIKEIVLNLRENGFNTTGSCEGGEGHAQDKPCVFIESRDHFPEKEKSLLEEWSKKYNLNSNIEIFGNPNVECNKILKITFEDVNQFKL